MYDDWALDKKEWRSPLQGSSKKATTQQKRKAKTTISVPAWHDLQEQACPSDIFLFYPDVEKEIEHATAAKLEGFIATKIRPIHHNNVSKWANQPSKK